MCVAASARPRRERRCSVGRWDRRGFHRPGERAAEGRGERLAHDQVVGSGSGQAELVGRGVLHYLGYRAVTTECRGVEFLAERQVRRDLVERLLEQEVERSEHPGRKAELRRGGIEIGGEQFAGTRAEQCGQERVMSACSRVSPAERHQASPDRRRPGQHHRFADRADPGCARRAGLSRQAA